MMYCDLLALSKADRHAMTIKSMLEDLSCEEEPHRSDTKIRKEERKKVIGIRIETLPRKKP